MKKEKDDQRGGEAGGAAGGELSAEEREALAAWEVPEVPEGFAARVVEAAAGAGAASGSATAAESATGAAAAAGTATGAAAAAGTATGAESAAGTAAESTTGAAAGTATAAGAAAEPDVLAGAAAGRSGAARRWGIVVVAAAAGLLLWQARGIREPAASGSAAAAGERVTAAIGRRGVAVVEPGGALSWIVDGDTVVTQAAGDVFYRVDRGGPFRVETPHGTVRVTGTCFRVELTTMKRHWHALAGAAIGAAIVVTVYEGSVIFADKSGEEREVRAGQELTAGPEGGVRIGEAGEAVADLTQELGEDASREELLARHQAQRAEILALRRRVAELEAGSAGRGGGPGDTHDPGGRPWFDPSQEDLARFAEECRVRYDLPPVMSTEPFQLGPRAAEQAGLSEAERAAINRVLAALHREHLAELRELYIEVTGDASRADDLSPQAMASELRDKSAPGDAERANQKIARERAGLIPPPADLSLLPPIERYLRLQAALGDLTEERLAEVIGRGRARELREKRGGWGWRNEQAGCPSEAPGAEVEAAR